ncbi:DUF1361 domain-containing protein [Liquorilactobacillus sicerae]|uniref:DUF1361 domain-containing protein n=1 Tax=Liquorilactobacillus sicerae TaxID=1416943 RepID=UPI002480DC76|nr:DUF1361 domain-containing protein [Liquorilactobacillus sicerae]
MTKRNRWLLRIFFWSYMLYIYLTVYLKGEIYSFLLLNTFLAYIPIEISFHIDYRQNNFWFFLLFIIWLLFFPNAPYELTDLFHLAMLDPYNSLNKLMVFNLHLWLKFTNLLIGALACTLVGTISLEYVADQVLWHLKRWSRLNQVILINILLVLSAIGIYIGRFLRLHTVYLILDPQWVIQQLISMWSWRMLVFVTFMYALQLLIWGCMFINRFEFQRLESQHSTAKPDQPAATNSPRD